LAGVVAGSSVNSNGQNASMSAPCGPSEQEVISTCCRAAGLSGFDVDAADTYGGGGFLADAVEVSSWARILRIAEGDTNPLGFTCMKTQQGNSTHAAGASSLMRAIYANQCGTLTPNCHLAQMNPHIDFCDQPASFATEMVEFRLRSSYYGALARGFGGTNSSAIAWGQVEEDKLTPTARRPERERLLFWPGGGGQLESSAQPRKGFHIAGTFTQWEPEPMEMEGTGVYGYDLTLGENRWEQFQVWLDGDPNKCLHPDGPKAARLTKVHGPDPTPEGFTWHIEGRTWSVPSSPEQGRATAALGDGTQAVAAPGAEGEQLAEVGGVDRGLIGAKYRVRLHIAGKYRMVDWERLSGKPEDKADAAPALQAAQALPPSSYCVSADWNGWGFQEMTSVPQADGSGSAFELEVQLLRPGGEFQIVRNRDWHQVFYPHEELSSCGDPKSVGGPDDESDGRTWFLDGKPGDVFRIELRRSNEQGFDVRQVFWEKTGERALSEEQKEAVFRTRYAVFGSWDGGNRLRELKWSGTYYYFYVELGSEVKESFQLVQELDWDKIFHPSVPDASPSTEHEIQGPSFGDGRTRGLNWTLGKEGYEKAGDLFEVKVYQKVMLFQRFITKVEWAKVPSGKSLKDAEAEGLVLRRTRR